MDLNREETTNWGSVAMPSKSTLPLGTLLNSMLMLTKTPLNYWAEFAVDIPLSAMLIFAGLRGNELGLIAVVLTILLGLFLFSIVEYSFHRWLLHGSIQSIAQGHCAHHENPLGYDSLPFFLPALTVLALTGVLVFLMPPRHAYMLTGVITLGYVIYGLSHFTIHHHRFHFVPARDWAANHHIHHCHANTNFGVTTPLWDMVFGTRYRRAS